MHLVLALIPVAADHGRAMLSVTAEISDQGTGGQVELAAGRADLPCETLNAYQAPWPGKQSEHATHQSLKQQGIPVT